MFETPNFLQISVTLLKHESGFNSYTPDKSKYEAK